MNRSDIEEWLDRTANGGSVTPGQADRMRKACAQIATYRTALEAIAAGDRNPIMLAKRALGRPEPGDTAA